MNPTRVLVIGGTGLLGEPVARALNDIGLQVRIATRDNQKARRKFDESYELYVGDLNDPMALQEALRDCSGVHISLPGQVELQVAESVARVASRSHIALITYISGATVAEENRWFPMINRKFLAEKAIRESGIPYVFLCPTWVMESLPLFIRQGRATVLGNQPCPYHWVAADDMARIVATSHKLKEATSKRFLMFGPEAITMHEALKRYCAAFHPEIRNVSSMPIWLLKILAMISRNEGLKEVAEMMAYFDKIGEGRKQEIDKSALGAATMTLDKWLARRRLEKPS